MLGNVVGPPSVGMIFDFAQTHGVPMPYFWALVHPILLLLMTLWLLRFVPEQARMRMLARVTIPNGSNVSISGLHAIISIIQMGQHL